MLPVIQRSFIAFLVAISIVLSVQAQNTKSTDKKAELNGYCPVAYLAMDKSIKGDAKYSSTYQGKTYYLANAEAKKMFDTDPKKYIPKYDGYCTTALAMGKLLKSDPKIFSVYNGATYLFSNKMAKESFDKDPKMMIKKADQNFVALTKKSQ